MRKKYKISLIIFVAGFFLATCASSTFAGSAHLTWNANSEGDLEGYTVYYDTTSHSGTCPSGYASNQDAGNVTSYWFDSLTPGQTYYFQLTAHDTTGNESGCSTSPGEVSKLVTYRGDLDADHDVDIFDFNAFRSGFGSTSCGPTYAPDIDRNCSVNIFDYNIFRGEFGSSF